MGGEQRYVVDGPGLVVRLVGTFQSIVSIGLFFLTALAIKRRFQISA